MQGRSDANCVKDMKMGTVTATVISVRKVQLW